jgi:dolichol-phosphate mannosyltransferase
MRVSIIVPVYNEEATLPFVLDRVLALPFEKEIILVDDGSTDDSAAILQQYEGRPGVKVIHHRSNQGKGRAVASALEQMSGPIAYIQDADLELDPHVCTDLIEPIESGEARVVHGRRIIVKGRPYLRSRLARRLLSLIFRLLYEQRLDDPTTGCKAMDAGLLKSLGLVESGFEVDQEMSARLARKGVSIMEVPVHYYPRTFAEGKKIRWRDGVRAVWVLVKYRFS